MSVVRGPSASQLARSCSTRRIRKRGMTPFPPFRQQVTTPKNSSKAGTSTPSLMLKSSMLAVSALLVTLIKLSKIHMMVCVSVADVEVHPSETWLDQKSTVTMTPTDAQRDSLPVTRTSSPRKGEKTLSFASKPRLTRPWSVRLQALRST